MGQRVNPILYRLGISSFWGCVNYPANNYIANFINTGVLFNLIQFYFRRKRIKLFNLECTFIESKLNIFLHVFENRLIEKSMREQKSRFLPWPPVSEPSQLIKKVAFKYFSLIKGINCPHKSLIRFKPLKKIFALRNL
jgi:hypothetical protein